MLREQERPASKPLLMRVVSDEWKRRRMRGRKRPLCTQSSHLPTGLHLALVVGLADGRFPKGRRTVG